MKTAVRPVRKYGKPHPPECWACGKTCPRQTHISKVGWHVRWTRIDRHRMRESYCPDCFARWGWPEETGGAEVKAKPTTAPVTCRTCGQTSEIPHEDIREASEADRPPPCPVCEARHKAMRPTAADVVLLAAAELHSLRLIHGDPTEFSEWDLSVAAWQRDPKRFGLRGYADRHPDHKRVTMEIMGQKPSSPVVQKLMVKVRPNTYRLTPAGVAQAEALLGMVKGKK